MWMFVDVTLGIDKIACLWGGWEAAMSGFLIFVLRWWRRNLLHTFRLWREKQYPVVNLSESGVGGIMVSGRRSHTLVT